MSASAGACCRCYQVNLKGVTPLRESLIRKPYNRLLVKLFLSRGADVSIVNSLGSSDIDYVKLIAHGEDADIIELFI